MHHPTDRITHTTAFVTPVVEHWLEQEIAPGLSFLTSSKGSFICTNTTRLTAAFITPVFLKHWLERETSQWVTKADPENPIMGVGGGGGGGGRGQYYLGEGSNIR